MSLAQVRLEELIKVHYGKALKESDRDRSGDWAVYGSSGAVGKHTSTLTDQTTIVIGRKGSVGDVTFAPNGGWTIDTAFYVEPIGDCIDLRYLYYAMRRVGFSQHTITTSIPGINRDDIYNTSIPLPSLPEQKRIAAILDKTDGIRRKGQKTIALTEKLLHSTFLEMFGDPVLNPKRWDMSSLGNLLTFLTSGSRGWAKYYSESGKMFLRIQNVGRNELLLDDLAFVRPPASAESLRTKVKAGDVLLSITADLGRTAVVSCDVGQAHINQHLAILRIRGIEPIYLSQFLSSIGGQRQFQRLNRVGVKSGLNFDDIRSLQIVCPPRVEQRRFVDFWYRHSATLAKQQRALNRTQELFGALSQRAFRGEL